MTEPERPAGGPAGNPTPEEISARLEALLKRTHTLRAQRSAPATPGGSLGVTWPPNDRELDRYDVGDVDEGETAAASSDSTTPATVAPPIVATRAPGSPDAAAHEFARPDWSELRLRSAGDGRS